jgi:hypothetical protein
VAAIIVGDPGVPAPKRAFATAPAGLYAVFSRSDRATDVIFAVAADGGGGLREIAVVPHLDGFSSLGAVSPDGRTLALVVADGGSPARPTSSLMVVDLSTGSLTRLAAGVDRLQTPLWATDSSSVIVTRTTEGAPLADVMFVRVAADGGGETRLRDVRGALGAYAVGFDQAGGFLAVVIDARGSTLVRNGAEDVPLAPNVTRDWRVSPDGSAIAFIEASTTNGLRYFQRVLPLDAQGARAQVGAPTAPALGVAWAPGAATPTFGNEPGQGGAGSARAQSTSEGFDIPLSYSPDGRLLAVQSWSGRSFDDAGTMRLALVSGSSRTVVPATRMYGWAAR